MRNESWFWDIWKVIDNRMSFRIFSSLKILDFCYIRFIVRCMIILLIKLNFMNRCIYSFFSIYARIEIELCTIFAFHV